jgi:iron complex transport system ATP-binding protein
VIEARGVTVRIGSKRLLDNVDVAIAAGELVAIVGPNGAGKSTLLAALAGDRRAEAGTIALAGRELRTLSISELARKRAVLPQRSQLALAFTSVEVVQLAGPMIGTELARRCLADVELADFATRTFPSLSGGEQQRVQLARVLAQLSLSPGAALLLDEPTSALDPKHQQLVLGLARRAAKAGHPVVVVLHDLTLAARWADRILLLSSGRVIADAAPDAVFTTANLEAAYATPFEVLRGQTGLVVVPFG